MRRFALLVLAAGCGRDEVDPGRTAKYFKEVKLDTAPGLSGLAVDDTNGLWTIAERDKKAYRITLDPQNTPTLETFAVEGVPEKLDLEAMAWLGADHFALGTEGKVDGVATVLLAERRGETLAVTRVIWLPETKLGIDLPANHGAEGLCGHGNTIIAAIEGSGIANGKRFAPIVRITDGEIERVNRLWLTTKVGKLSALDCTVSADGTADVIAIERHFSVTKILRFTLPMSDADITPIEALDLGEALQSRLNLEGIAKTLDGRYFAIVDNQWKTLHGPSLLLVFEAGVVKERQ